MKSKLIQNGISVKKSALHGHGVFAEKSLKKGEIIEECRIFFTDGKESGLLDYFFQVEDKIAFLSGHGSLYNHSNDPNVAYYFEIEYGVAIFEAQRAINAGDELLIDYGECWFSKRSMQIKQIPQWKKFLYPKYSLGMRAGIACGTLLLVTKLLSLHLV